MYDVSEAYRQSMDAQIRNESIVEFSLFNVDAYVQSRLTIASDSNADYGMYGGITKVSSVRSADIATLEKDFMTADGSYSLRYPPDYYISTRMSSTTPDSNGEYPLALSMSVTLDFSPDYNSTSWLYGIKPITLVFGRSERRVSVTLKYDYSGSQTFSKVYLVENGKLVLNDLPKVEPYVSITITILTLNKPQQKARFRKILAGELVEIDTSDVLDFTYRDINDCVCIELPEKSCTCSVNNLHGQYDQETEYDNPTFRKFHTQAAFRIGYYVERNVVEWISMGRFFLKEYKVSEEEIRFSFTDAIGLLNDFLHEWADPYPNTLDKHLTDIMQANIEIVEGSPVLQGEKTAAQVFGISLSFANAINQAAQINNSCPLVSAAQALQLYANLTGNKIRSRGNTYFDFFIEEITTTSNRDLLLYQCYSMPVWSTDDKINAIETDIFKRSSTASPVEITTGINMYQGETYGFRNDQLFFDASASGTGSGIAIQASQYAHRIYLKCLGGNLLNATVSAHVYNTSSQSTFHVMSAKDGISFHASNPLLSDADDIRATAYASRLYDELKHNVFAELHHRGFPELDAGDVINVEFKPGVFTKSRIIENMYQIQQGSVSGTTKVRRLS